MSHSHIYQISNKPIKKDDYIDESKYYDNFCGNIADYVSGGTNRENDIKWFANCLENVISVKGDKFTIINKKAFFEPRYMGWRKTLNELSKCSIEEFMTNDLDIKEYTARQYYNDKYEMYVDDGESGYQTLSEFFRYANDGDVWYIGATIDYHM